MLYFLPANTHFMNFKVIRVKSVKAIQATQKFSFPYLLWCYYYESRLLPRIQEFWVSAMQVSCFAGLLNTTYFLVSLYEEKKKVKGKKKNSDQADDPGSIVSLKFLYSCLRECSREATVSLDLF